jgi:hypothetical protein
MRIYGMKCTYQDEMEAGRGVGGHNVRLFEGNHLEDIFSCKWRLDN